MVFVVVLDMIFIVVDATLFNWSPFSIVAAHNSTPESLLIRACNEPIDEIVDAVDRNGVLLATSTSSTCKENNFSSKNTTILMV